VGLVSTVGSNPTLSAERKTSLSTKFAPKIFAGHNRFGDTSVKDLRGYVRHDLYSRVLAQLNGALQVCSIWAICAGEVIDLSTSV